MQINNKSKDVFKLLSPLLEEKIDNLHLISFKVAVLDLKIILVETVLETNG